MAYGIGRTGQLLYLPLQLLQPGNSRGTCSAPMQELAASVREVGILQPLTVRKIPEGYGVVSGNRRLMAARMAGLQEVPCILLALDGADAALIGLTENLQREDLHFFEEAELLQEYLRRSGLTQGAAAKRLGRSQSALANKLRLLTHTPPVRRAIREQGLGERHARALLRVEGEKNRLAVLEEIRGLTAAQCDRYIDGFLENRDTARKFRRRDTRLLLEHFQRDALRLGGVPADVERQDDGAVVVTVRIPRD